MNTLKSLSFTALLALAPTLALAQTPPPAPGAAAPAPAKGHRVNRLKAADTDGDGMLSRAEVDAAGIKNLSKNFDAIDANKDGKLSRDEMKAYRLARKAARQGSGAAAAAAPAAPGK
ncbi:MAG TPA: hypothetical protein VGN52_20755 [Burkholderiales bacterium]